jgi:hypothetical protein
MTVFEANIKVLKLFLCLQLKFNPLKISRAINRVDVELKTKVLKVSSTSTSGSRKPWFLIQYWHGGSPRKTLAHLSAVQALNFIKFRQFLSIA